MPITTVEFGWVSELVRREAAIVLEPGKEYLVEARLLPLARADGLADTAQYVRQAQQVGNETHRRAIVEAQTTNETSWFRDPAVFESFRRELLPRLLADRPAFQSLHIWSAAASTGQEAYSLAMLLSEELGPGRRFEIVGTDISHAVLAQARAGRYSQMEVNRGLPARHLVQYFQRVGAGWQVSPILQRSVQFRELNLAVPFPPGLPRFDVVFLRNVLIYFDVPTKQAILRRVRQVAAPEGWLVLGTAETTRGIDDGFELVRMGGLSAYKMAPDRSQQPSRRAYETCTQS
jgi:chemotaxis protein methyltransferase CheR